MSKKLDLPGIHLGEFARHLLGCGISNAFDNSKLKSSTLLAQAIHNECKEMDLLYGDEDWDTELSTFDVHEILGLWVMFTERFDLPVNLTLALHYIIEEDMMSNPAQMILELLLCTHTPSDRNQALFLSIMKWFTFLTADQKKMDAFIEEALFLYSMRGAPMDKMDWRAPLLGQLLGQEKIQKLSRLEQAKYWLEMQLEDVLSNF